MKTFLFFLFISSLGFSQSVEYGKPIKKGNYTIYKSKDGTTVKVGDTLHINPINSNQYTYISQGNIPAGPVISNKDIIITKLKVWSQNKATPKLYIAFKGFGMLPVYIDYESALEIGEIYNLNSDITRDEALAILKEKKELLDLELISQKEYDKIKVELSPIILSKK